MATYKHLRSSTANKRPTTSITDGQLAINTNTASPGLFFKDSAGTGIVKVGPVHVGTTAPNATPAAGGSSGNYTGEQWLDTSVSPAQMKVWNGSAWVGIVADELPVSKLQDGAARQLLQTDAAGTGVEWTSNVDVPGTLDVTGATTLDSTLTVPLGSAAAPTVRFTGDTNTGIYSPGADQVAVATNGTGRLFVDANGDVGVGTASPSDTSGFGGTLDINGTTGAACYVRTNGSATDYGLIGHYGADFYVNNNSNGPTRFFTNGSERLRITSAGLVGIGTSSPGSRLEIGGDASYDATITFNRVPVHPSNDGVIGELFFQNNADSVALIAVKRESAADDAYIQFATQQTTGGLSEKVRITSAGLVGIGTSAPTHQLQVSNTSGSVFAGLVSSISGVNDFYFGDTDNLYAGRLRYDHATDHMSVWTNGAERLRITSAGNVGIGTASPSAKLEVVGGNIRLDNNQGVEWGGVNNYIYGNESTDFIAVATNGNERSRWDSSGRLLVGTSSNVDSDDGYQPSIQVAGVAAKAAISVARYQAANPYGAQLFLQRSKTDTIGAQSIMSSGDEIGLIQFEGSDGTKFRRAAGISAQVDGTPGANDMPGRLSFHTTPAGASSPTERVRITQAGHLYIANTTGDYNTVGITLFSNGQAQANANGVNPLNLNRKGSDGKIVDFYRDTNNPGSISVTTTATTYATSSDYRLKENVTPVTDGITRLQQLRPSRFNFIADPAKTVDGFIAHEAQAVVPECVTGTKDEVDADGNPIYQGIDQSKLVPLLTAALQEAIAKIEALEARLTAAGI